MVLRLPLVGASLVCLALAAPAVGNDVAPSVISVPAACSARRSCVAELNAALKSCAAAGAPCTVQLDVGAQYDLYAPDGTSRPVSVDASGAVGLTLDGRGSTIVLHNMMGFLFVQGGTGVSVLNLKVDMGRKPYTYGQVLSSDSSSSTLSVSTSEYSTPQASGHGWLNTVQAILGYDPVAGRPATGAVDVYAALGCAWRDLGGGKALVTLQHGNLPLGSWMILRHQVYGLDALSFWLSTDVLVQDVVFHAVPGMGVYTNEVTGVTLRRVQVRKPPGRPMSITADATHFESCHGGDVLVDSCFFEGQGDDGGNIPTRYWDLRSISPDRRSAEVRQQNELRPFSGKAGDVLRFYHRRTFQAYGLDGAVAVAGVDGATLKFSAPLPPEAEEWDLVVNMAHQPRSVTIVGTTYKDNRARGHLLPVSNVLVSNCTFDHTSGPGVLVYPDGCHWFEGDAIAGGNWTIERSRFVGVNYGPGRMPGDIFIAAQVPTWSGGQPTRDEGPPASEGQQHAGVTVKDTLFLQEQATAAVTAHGIRGLTLVGNTVQYNVAATPALNFEVHHSVAVVDQDNRCGPAQGPTQPCRHLAAGLDENNLLV